jgi:hypothetical protein
MAKQSEAPSNDNSHEQNVKLSLEAVLGGTAVTRKVRKSAEDKRKDAFCIAMNAMEQADSREFILTNDFNLDLGTYNEAYSDAINALLDMLFNAEQRKLIDFYLYDRFSDDGALVALVGENNQDIFLESSGDLYDLLKTLK